MKAGEWLFGVHPSGSRRMEREGKKMAWIGLVSRQRRELQCPRRDVMVIAAAPANGIGGKTWIPGCRKAHAARSNGQSFSGHDGGITPGQYSFLAAVCLGGRQSYPVWPASSTRVLDRREAPRA